MHNISLVQPQRLLLNDHGLEEAIASRRITIAPEPAKDQLQPASLDIRIGKVKLYDPESMRRTAEHYSKLSLMERMDGDITDEFAKEFPDSKDTPVDIPPKSFAEIYFHEKIDFDRELYDLGVDLRSSRGRMGLSLWPESVQKTSSGMYVSLWNFNPNPIRLYSQDKFAQLFFYPRTEKIPCSGHVVADSSEAEQMAAKVCEKPEMIGPYIAFSQGDYLLKFNKNLGAIDTRKKYDDEFLYEKIETSEPVEILPYEAVICQLAPKLCCPANIGIQLLHQIPYLQTSFSTSPDPSLFFLESRAANAGWVDPGYKGNITAHPFRMKFPAKLKKGDTLALGLIHYYSDSAARAYGSEELGSHYQNSEGVGARS